MAPQPVTGGEDLIYLDPVEAEVARGHFLCLGRLSLFQFLAVLQDLIQPDLSEARLVEKKNPATNSSFDKDCL